MGGLYANTIQVNDVKVDVTAKSSLAARDQAIIKARQVAFKKMAQENVDLGIPDTAAIPSDDVLENMVDDYEIVKEKLSNVRYIGTFNISFNKRSVTKYLAGPDKYRSNSPSSEGLQSVSLMEAAGGLGSVKQSPTKLHSGKLSYVLIPVYISEDDSLLWEDTNLWHLYWVKEETKTQGKEFGIDYTVPLADLRDIQALTIEEALTVKTQAISKLLERYQKEAAVLVMIKKIDDTGNTHELTLKDFTRGGINRSIDIITLEAHNQKLEAVFAAAKKKAFEFMQGHLSEGDISVVQVGPTALSSDNDEQGESNEQDDNTDASDGPGDAYRPTPMNPPSTGEARGIPIQITYNSLKEWQDVRRKLSAQPWIQSYDVVSFNKDQAQIMIESNLTAAEVESKLSALGVNTSGGRDADYRTVNIEGTVGSNSDGGALRPAKLAPLSIRHSAPRQD